MRYFFSIFLLFFISSSSAFPTSSSLSESNGEYIEPEELLDLDDSFVYLCPSENKNEGCRLIKEGQLEKMLNYTAECSEKVNELASRYEMSVASLTQEVNGTKFRNRRDYNSRSNNTSHSDLTNSFIDALSNLQKLNEETKAIAKFYENLKKQQDITKNLAFTGSVLLAIAPAIQLGLNTYGYLHDEIPYVKDVTWAMFDGAARVFAVSGTYSLMDYLGLSISDYSSLEQAGQVFGWLGLVFDVGVVGSWVYFKYKRL